MKRIAEVSIPLISGFHRNTDDTRTVKCPVTGIGEYHLKIAAGQARTGENPIVGGSRLSNAESSAPAATI